MPKLFTSGPLIASAGQNSTGTKLERAMFDTAVSSFYLSHLEAGGLLEPDW